MARIFSWKITNGKYAYLVKDEENNTYIRNRINDSLTLLAFSKTILGFSENQYMAEYNNLRNEVLSLYGKDIGSDYSVYYDTGEDGGSNRLILLTGKDGENASSVQNNNGVISNNDYETLSSIIDTRIDEYQERENLLRDDVKEYIEASIGSSVSNAMENIIATNARLDALQLEVNDVISNDSDIINAIDVFTGATQNNMATLLSDTTALKGWMNDYSGSISGIVHDYNEANYTIGSMDGANPSSGLFANIGTCFNKLNNKIGKVESQCYELSGTVETIRKPISNDDITQILSSKSVINKDSCVQQLSSEDGIVFKYSDNAFMSFLSGEITLQSGDYGLKITNDGIFVRKKGGDYIKQK
jgi:hypothetical protein